MKYRRNRSLSFSSCFLFTGFLPCRDEKRDPYTSGDVSCLSSLCHKVLTFLRENTKPRYEPWSSSIKIIIVSKTKPPSDCGRCRTMCDQHLLDTSQPSVCWLVPFFKSGSSIFQSTCCCWLLKMYRLPSKMSQCDYWCIGVGCVGCPVKAWGDESG